MCTESLTHMTERNDAVLGIRTKLPDECDIEYDTSYISLDNLKPDIVIKYNNSCYFVDITIPYDSITNMESAANRMIEKYRHLGYIIPFCVGYLGSWYSGNQILKTEMNFPSNTWKTLRPPVLQRINRRFGTNFIEIIQLFLTRFIILLSILSCIFSLLSYSLLLTVFITIVYCSYFINFYFV